MLCGTLDVPPCCTKRVARPLAIAWQARCRLFDTPTCHCLLPLTCASLQRPKVQFPTCRLYMAPYIVADGKDLLIHMHAGPIPNIHGSAVGVGARPPTLAVEESKWSTRKESKIWPRGRSAGRRPSASARPTRLQDRVCRCRQFDGTSPLSHLSGALPCPAAAPCQPVSRVLPLTYPPFPAPPMHFPVREISP